MARPAILTPISPLWRRPTHDRSTLAANPSCRIVPALLVYLQVILFFQEKNPRLYWQMILLSLLQVVVGAALHLGFAFGVLLLLYTVVALSTMILFFIHRETERHAELLISPQLAAPER